MQKSEFGTLGFLQIGQPPTKAVTVKARTYFYRCRPFLAIIATFMCVLLYSFDAFGGACKGPGKDSESGTRENLAYGILPDHVQPQ